MILETSFVLRQVLTTLHDLRENEKSVVAALDSR